MCVLHVTRHSSLTQLVQKFGGKLSHEIGPRSLCSLTFPKSPLSFYKRTLDQPSRRRSPTYINGPWTNPRGEEILPCSSRITIKYFPSLALPSSRFDDYDQEDSMVTPDLDELLKGLQFEPGENNLLKYEMTS